MENSREKQIEEMASDFCALNMPCEECHLYKNRCHAKKYATRAYNAGYRKADDVAEEIFAEVEKCVIGTLEPSFIQLRDRYVNAELKKKYTEEGK